MSYIDTRELAEELDALEERLQDDGEEFSAEEYDRLNALRTLREDIGEEWRYGATLIPENEFEEYARELAEDIGAIPSDYSWPASHIDWEAAARALRMDYTSVTFDGDDYLVRL